MSTLRTFIQNVLSTNAGELGTQPPQFHGNHVEFVIIPPPKDIQSAADGACMVYGTNFECDAFYKLMYKMMDTYYKYHQKQFKETVIGNVYYHNHKNEDISIYSINTTTLASFQDKVLSKVQHKNKLTILSLPSTTNIHNETYMRKLTFRVTNRIFVNFENSMCENIKCYRVTVNYNHDKDVDLSGVVDSLEKVLKILI